MRVLVIEDEIDLLRSLRQVLNEEGFSVDVAANGENGLYKAESGSYDVIVLDLMLPGMDGWSLLSRLRASGSLVPVLVLTARDAVFDRVRGLNLGADDYLTKPFALEELLARLRALIRRDSRRPSPIVQVGDIEIDTVARLVRRDGQEVALTAREYCLLEYLVVHRGEIVSRAQIYEHIYDEHDDTLSNVVDVYVSNLRRKLGRELIETRRGHGYLIRG